MVSKGADLSIEDNYGNLPVSAACSGDASIEVIKTVINPDVANHTDNIEGRSPLHIAVAKNNHEAAKFL